MGRQFSSGLAAGLALAVLLTLAAALIVVYSGAYDVAASKPHSDVVRWSLDTTMRRSVQSRADTLDLQIPEEGGRLTAAARHYAESCAQCHGAPGVEPAAWSRGMRPEPPHLVEAAREWSAAEVAWIVTHGIRMSGMPAFGEHHSGDEIAAIAGFVVSLPGLSPDQYAAMHGDDAADADSVGGGE